MADLTLMSTAMVRSIATTTGGPGIWAESCRAIKVDESQVVELNDGSIMANMRDHFGYGERAVALSNDGGVTWKPAALDPTLIEPDCQGSIIRYTEQPACLKNRLLFSNPASKKDRVNMTVRLSYDEGKTWPIAKQIFAGSAAYSCLTVLPDMSRGLSL